MSQIIERAQEIKEKHRKKVNAELSDRVRYETKDTLAFIERQRVKGKSDKEIARDLERSRYKNQGQ